MARAAAVEPPVVLEALRAKAREAMEATTAATAAEKEVATTAEDAVARSEAPRDWASLALVDREAMRVADEDAARRQTSRK